MLVLLSYLKLQLQLQYIINAFDINKIEKALNLYSKVFLEATVTYLLLHYTVIICSIFSCCC